MLRRSENMFHISISLVLVLLFSKSGLGLPTSVLALKFPLFQIENLDYGYTLVVQNGEVSAMPTHDIDLRSSDPWFLLKLGQESFIHICSIESRTENMECLTSSNGNILQLTPGKGSQWKKIVLDNEDPHEEVVILEEMQSELQRKVLCLNFGKGKDRRHSVLIPQLLEFQRGQLVPNNCRFVIKSF